MANISKDPNGNRRIQFTGTYGKRQTLRLGKVTDKVATRVCGRIETLLAHRITGTAIDRDTASWLSSIGEELLTKLANLELIERPAESGGEMPLATLLDTYLASRADLKKTTRIVLLQTRRLLVAYFGAGKPIGEISLADADEWRVWLATQASKRKGKKIGLSENTIRRHCGRARQYFAVALKRKQIELNPFSELATAVRSNRARQYFVSRETIQAVIDAAPDVEWRTIITLSRYGGLRVPSELLTLRWADVDFKRNAMTIRASKTEHHEDGGIRLCPIFAELMPFLEAARAAAEPGSEFVVSRYRESKTNLRTQFRRIIKRAGFTPWPKLFHNLRATRQTELFKVHSIQDVCSWLRDAQNARKLASRGDGTLCPSDERSIRRCHPRPCS